MEPSDSGSLRQRTAPIDAKPLPTFTDGLQDTNRGARAEHPGGRAHHPVWQAVRITALAIYFIACCLCMFTTQLMGAWLYWYNKEWYYAWMAMTKAHFGLLTVTMQQYWSPTLVRVSGDESVKGQLTKTADGRLECDFPERMVLLANHELYTDWLYLWWVAYTAKMHGHIYIILKESLKYIPLLGWGMQFFSFVFLTRNWTNDKQRFAHRLDKLKRKPAGDKAYNPMWMIIFPEGTNLSRNGRAKSSSWAQKQGIPDLRHALLPRSTGLRFTLDELGTTVEWVYDCTLAYEGIPRGQYGQDIFSLNAIYLQGRAPKSVNMHWRCFAIKDIPKDPETFDDWVQQRWREKDDLLEHFMQTGYFPAAQTATIEYREIPNGAGITKPVKIESYIETKIQPQSPTEFVQIFVPAFALGLVLNLVRTFVKRFG